MAPRGSNVSDRACHPGRAAGLRPVSRPQPWKLAAERKLLTVPADPAEAARLARRYVNRALGEIAVRHDKGKTVFDFGEFRSQTASRKNPDGTLSFITTAPGIIGFEFVVGNSENGQRTLTVRDAQHEYVFAEAGS